jgi:hypothetical protein
MKPTPLLLTALSLLSILALPATAQDSKAKKKPAAEKSAPEKKPESKEEKPAETAEVKLTKEQSILKQALDNHSRLNGYHVDVVLKTPGGNATLTGALGNNSLSLLGTDVKGVKKKRVVTEGEFYLSEDDGKTWKKGDDAEKDATLLFNNIITAPVQMKEGIIKEATLTMKEEKLNGEDVLHIEKPAKDKAAAVHFWICKEPEMKNMTFIRKAELVVSGTDLELLATITYSKLTEPVKIETPDAK